MKRFAVLAVIAALVVAGSWWVEAQKGSPPAYPRGYRNWHHVKSMVLEEGHPLYKDFGGIHHVYANDAARKGLQTGTYADGAVLVFDLFDAPREGGALTEGARKVLAVMEKNNARFAATGGWGFEAFAGGDEGKRLVTDAVNQCFLCHQSQESKGYVFSAWRP